MSNLSVTNNELKRRCLEKSSLARVLGYELNMILVSKSSPILYGSPRSHTNARVKISDSINVYTSNRIVKF